ncbi:PEP-CTERM sorting domain-containing protein [Opitutaceae bacterium EW11]|nr:PEP-CTERM sorting domain-containing protein [Opitutaceae bacterium EW11]
MKRLSAHLVLLTALLALSGIVPEAHAQLVDFDDLPPAPGDWIPSDYHGMHWYNFQYLTGNTLPGSGYEVGTISPGNVAYNGFGQPAVFWDDAPFDLTSLFLTAAWNDDLSVTLLGFSRGELAYDRSLTVSTDKPTFVFLDWYNVDVVYLATSGGIPNPDSIGVGTHVAIDNMLFNRNYPVPEPATWGTAGAVLLGMLSLSRFRLGSRKSGIT